MVGVLFVTFRVNAASNAAPQSSVVRIVIVCDPIGPAFVIDTTPLPFTVGNVFRAGTTLKTL